MVTAKQQIEVRPKPRSRQCHVGTRARRTSWLVVHWASPSLFRHVVQDSKYYPALSTVDSIRQQLSTAYDQPFIHRVKLWLPELSNQASKPPHPSISDTTAIHHRVDSHALLLAGWLQIKAAALRDVGQWLVTTRANSVAVGKGALRKCTNFMTGLGEQRQGAGCCACVLGDALPSV